ncbi:MAG: hypothetical protein HY540_02915 [Deltaproteobacteria bacterium]|nr:hypothetical protein [Deltaproteobacteria bacterium]
MKKLLLLFLLIASPAQAFTTTGFSEPAGIAIDPTTQQIYISNMNGSSDSKDSNGFISRLSADGTVEATRFIDGVALKMGLHAPKGMEIVEKYLYVADLDVLHVFELPIGKPLADIRFPESVKNLMDVTKGPDEALYAVDGPGNAMYRIDLVSKEVTMLTSGDSLGEPSALEWHPGKQMFVVANFGLGRLKAFDVTGKPMSMPAIFLRTVKGLAVDESGKIYASSLTLGGVYRISSDFVVEAVQSSVVSPMALAFSKVKKEFIVILSESQAVQSLPLN